MWYRGNCSNKASVYDKRLEAILPTGKILEQQDNNIFYMLVYSVSNFFGDFSYK